MFLLFSARRRDGPVGGWSRIFPLTNENVVSSVSEHYATPTTRISPHKHPVLAEYFLNAGLISHALAGLNTVLNLGYPLFCGPVGVNTWRTCREIFFTRP